jgi:serine phosphatase RsbU (regulator of sigma subunit)
MRKDVKMMLPIYWIIFYIMFILYVYGHSKYKARKYNAIIRERDHWYQEVQRHHEETLDSIRYAERLQKSLFPHESQLQELFTTAFLLHIPKDIVSGDFVWWHQKDHKIFIAVADSTGHGVPGAFMSILGLNVFQQCAVKDDLSDPQTIFSQYFANFTPERIRLLDGMDVGLLVIDQNRQELHFAGANRNLYLYRRGELLEFKGNRQSINLFKTEDGIPVFTQETIPYYPGDIVYLFTDGYTDQFGGDQDKKFKIRKFKQLLTRIGAKNLATQKVILAQTFHTWKGSQEQIDDVMILGIQFENII